MNRKLRELINQKRTPALYTFHILPLILTELEFAAAKETDDNNGQCGVSDHFGQLKIPKMLPNVKALAI